MLGLGLANTYVSHVCFTCGGNSVNDGRAPKAGLSDSSTFALPWEDEDDDEDDEEEEEAIIPHPCAKGLLWVDSLSSLLFMNIRKNECR